MQLFTAFEYLCIDVANQWGLDKDLYEDRLDWVYTNINDLEVLGINKLNTGEKWKEYPLYVAAVMALNAVRRGEPTGHMVGFDATCSGVQIMAVTTGCYEGAVNSNLVDPNVRADAYTKTLTYMQQDIPTLPSTERKPVKQAVMTSFYGSEAIPKKIFGDGTPELAIFYKALERLSPGSFEFLSVFKSTWDPDAEFHSWTMPDAHHVNVPVEVKRSAKIEIDELGHHCFMYEFKEIGTKKKGVSNVANVVHSLDSYLLRSLIRRCNYDRDVVEAAVALIDIELLSRTVESECYNSSVQCEPALYNMIKLYEATGIADITIFEYLSESGVACMSLEHLKQLQKVAYSMVSHPPFPVVTVHDEFRCHAGNMNVLRQVYLDLMIELANSTVLTAIYRELTGDQTAVYEKLDSSLGTKLADANYHLC